MFYFYFKKLMKTTLTYSLKLVFHLILFVKIVFRAQQPNSNKFKKKIFMFLKTKNYF